MRVTLTRRAAHGDNPHTPYYIHPIGRLIGFYLSWLTAPRSRAPLPHAHILEISYTGEYFGHRIPAENQPPSHYQKQKESHFDQLWFKLRLTLRTQRTLYSLYRFNPSHFLTFKTLSCRDDGDGTRRNIVDNNRLLVSKKNFFFSCIKGTHHEGDTAIY